MNRRLDDSMRLYLPDAKLPDLCTLTRFEKAAGSLRSANELWLNLPHEEGFSFPLYPTVTVTPLLQGFIRENSIYGADPKLDTNHYLSVTFRDDGTALIVMQYQHIIGSRWLCVVSQDDVRAFMLAGVQP